MPSPARPPEATYLLHQVVRYEYAGRVHDLRQVLRLVPPSAHGDQARIGHGLEVGGAPASTREGTDRFGNHVVEVAMTCVERFVEFEVWATVERASAAGTADTHERPFLRSTDRTRLSPARVREIGVGAGDAAAVHRVREICSWVHGVMRYAPGTTTVGTTAAEALERRQGVCQDYAHIMLALCRANGVPARYVSGHLLGEGGSHAWVEVLLPTGDGGRRWEAFDPTHDRRTTLDYITVGVGRDYSDVAPLTGTYRGPHAGILTVTKRAVRNPVPQPA